MSQGTQITIPALGRHALLGFLYDERSDLIFSKYVFKGPVTGNAITSTDNSKTSLKMSLTDTNRDKFRLYDIKANIQANLLSGMLQVKGSAGYLQEEKQSAREITGIILYECATTVENLHIYFESLKDQYNTDVINQTGATHIVTQIKWGGNVAIEFSKKVDEDSNEKQIKGSLEVEFEKAKGLLSIKGSASTDIHLADKESSSEFSVNVKGDILLPNKIPTTAEQVQDLFKQIPKLIKKVNDGKGVPLEFTLTPLGHLRSHLKQTSIENEFAKQLDEAILNDFINIFEKISEVGQELNDYIFDFHDNPLCVSHHTLKDIKTLKEKFLSSKLKFQGRMKEAIISVRSRIMEQDVLSKIAEDYEASEFSPTNVQFKLQRFEQTSQKIELYKTICKSFPNVKYFGFKSNLNAALLRHIKNIIYVLYLFPTGSENNVQIHQENDYLFFHKLNHPFNKLFVVDCEFEFVQSPKVKQTVIQQIVDGRVNIEDVNEVVKRLKISNPVEMKALGREGKLGQLYNARTDTFLKDNFLSPEMPESVIQVQKSSESGFVDVFDVPSEKMSDKFKSLNVDPELQFSILAGMIPLSRSGQYLAQGDESASMRLTSADAADKSSFRSFVHLRRLTAESISVSDPNLLKYIVANALSKGATHFVTKVDYGILSIFSAQQKQFIKEKDEDSVSSSNGEENSKNDSHFNYFKETLKGIVKRMRISNEGSNNRLTGADLEKLSEDFIVKVYSDLQEEGIEPERIQGNMDLLFFLNDIFVPKQLSKNNGKGMPISFVLYPLANLGIEVGILSPFINYGRISQNFPNPKEIIDILDEITIAKNQVEQISNLLHKNYDCVTDKDFEIFHSIRQEFDSSIGKFQEDFKNAIINIKKGETNSDTIKQLLLDYKNYQVFDNKHRYVKLQGMDIVMENIFVWNKFKKDINITCIGRPTSANSFNQIFADKNCANSFLYFLFYRPSWAMSNGNLWRKNSAAFLNLMNANNDGRRKLYVVNCDFDHEFCGTVEQPTIHEYTNGILTSNDFIVTQEERAKTKLEGELDLKTQVRDSQDSLESNICKVERDVQENLDSLKSLLLSKVENQKLEIQSQIQNISSGMMQYVITQIDPGVNITNLECGGIVNLPKEGSMYLRYKVSGQIDEEKNCLWTLQCKYNLRSYLTTLRISLLWDGLNLNRDGSLDTLTIHDWDPSRSESLSCFSLRSSTSVFLSDKFTAVHFLYLNSKRCNPGAEFIVKVDVIEIVNYKFLMDASPHWWFNTVPGSLSSSQRSAYGLTSIAIVPQKPLPFQFTVDHMYSNDVDDVFCIYELCEGGMARELKRWQGKITDPISFSTKYPILAIRRLGGKETTSFKLYWK